MYRTTVLERANRRTQMTGYKILLWIATTTLGIGALVGVPWSPSDRERSDRSTTAALESGVETNPFRRRLNRLRRRLESVSTRSLDPIFRTP